MVLIHIFRGYTITNLILDLNSVIFTPSIKSLIAIRERTANIPIYWLP